MKSYLIDSNVFLEALLKQQNSSIAYTFLKQIKPNQIFISKFSLYSIALILNNRNLSDQFILFARNYAANINMVELDINELAKISENVMKKTGLDFDDSYQYLCVKKYKLELVSFDKDFDKTDIKRIDPSITV